MTNTRSVTDIQVAKLLGRNVEDETTPQTPEERPLTVTEQQVAKYQEKAQSRASRRREAAEDDDD